ncbi:MAG: hypothetical protein FWG50_02650 [Kiritimatiellaeota bacterium]|nr:hypothetical protein [Kiritimatiellota bacterium]
MRRVDVRKAAGFMGAVCAAAWLAAAPGAAMAQVTLDPWSVWYIGFAHEKGLADGLALLTPGTDRHVADMGLIPMPDGPEINRFPDFFLNGLAATQSMGFTVWPMSAVIDDASGVTGFYNANGQHFASIAPRPGCYASNWVARLWLGDPPPEPLDPIYLPSKLETRWTFVAPSNMSAYAAARLSAAYTNVPPGGGGAPASPLFQVPGLRISEFRPVEGGFHFGLDAGGLAAYPHPMFHVLFSADLAARDWRPVAREAVPPAQPGGGASLAVPYAAVFGAENPFAVAVTYTPWWDGSGLVTAPQTGQHAPWCVQTTNTVISPLFPYADFHLDTVSYTRVTCSCGARGAASPRGFFALVSDVDSAGCGVPDWWLNLHGVNPAGVLDPVPGAEWIDFRDLYLSGMSPNDLPTFAAGLSIDVPFSVSGDFAAWEMTVKGAGPTDFVTRRIGPSAIGSTAAKTLALFKGNTYTVSMRWVDSTRYADMYWYCWESLVDGLPVSYTFDNYDPVRIPGAYTTIRGNGFVVNNASGLFTSHTHMSDSGGGNVAGGLTATLYVYAVGEDWDPVAIGFKAAGGAPTETPAVSKWEGAFRLDGADVAFKAPNFIGEDPDRFHIYVKDRRRTEPTIQCDLRDGPPPGHPRAQTLYRQPDGTYLSTNLIIVADAADTNRNALWIAGAEEGLPGLMVLRALGGGLQIEYSHDGIATSAVATVGQDVKTLAVDVAVMRDGPGQGACVTEQRVRDDMRTMQERYAQANIKVVWNETTFDIVSSSFDPPPIIATNMTKWIAVTVDGQAQLHMTTNTWRVIEASGLGTNNVRVIYVPGKIRGEDGPTGNLLADADGFAFADHGFESMEDKLYVDTCFVSSNETPNHDERLGPAHETLHLFKGEHVAERWNIMYPSPLLVDDPCGTRRLTQEQVNTIRTEGMKRGKLK